MQLLMSHSFRTAGNKLCIEISRYYPFKIYKSMVYLPLDATLVKCGKDLSKRGIVNVKRRKPSITKGMTLMME